MTPDTLAKSGTEHAEQRALFAWCNMAERYGFKLADRNESYTVTGYAKAYFDVGEYYPIPQLKWLHAIHNQGHGDAIRGARSKAEGVKPGVADLFLPVPVRTNYISFAGLYIEMKRADKGKLSIEQSEFARDMQDAGYKWACCFGWKNARDEILKYLGLV